MVWSVEVNSEVFFANSSSMAGYQPTLTYCGQSLAGQPDISDTLLDRDVFNICKHIYQTYHTRPDLGVTNAQLLPIQRRYDMNGRFQMQGGKNWILQTGFSGTLIGWKAGQSTFVPLWDRMEGAWLWKVAQKLWVSGSVCVSAGEKKGGEWDVGLRM